MAKIKNLNKSQSLYNRITFIIILIACCSTQSLSQATTHVKGRVSTPSNKAVPFANVAIFNTHNQIIGGDVTDSLGVFQITDVTEGLYKLQVHFIGFVPYQQDSIYISDLNETDLGTIIIKRQKTRLEEVEVVAERPFMEQSLGQTTINVGEHLSGAGESAIDLMRFVPSVSTDEDNNVLLRGAPVTILVDGVETDLANILEQLPAETVDKLEIITNPSAKYASRNGNGIINIVLKKDKIKGSNSRIQAAVGHPEKWLFGTSYTLRMKKLASYSYVNYNHNTDEQTTETHRTTVLNNNESNLINKGVSKRNMDNLMLRQGFKYQINKSQFIDLRGLYQISTNEFQSFNSSHVYKADSSLKNHTKNTAYGEYKRRYWEVNGRWKKEFKNKSSLNLFAKYEQQFIDNPSHRFIQPYNISDGSVNQSYTTQNRAYPETTTSSRLKFDYEYPISEKLKFETGGIVIQRRAKASNKYLKTKYTYNTDDETFTPSSDSTKSNSFIVNEISPALYSVISTEIKGIYASVGLRYEYTHIEPYSITSDTGLIQQYHKLLPTLQLSTNLGEKFSIGFSWSKRIKQPKYKQLNPFVIYNGLYSKSGGNPQLKPQEINNYELSAHWQLSKHSFSPSLFHKQNTGLISQYQHIIIEDEREVMYRQYLNIGNSQQYGFELNMSNRITESWSLKSNFLIMHQTIKHYAKAHYFNVNDLSYNAKITSDILLPQNFRLQLTGVYESPTNTVSGLKYELYFFDLGLRKSILKKKGALYLKYADALNTLERRKLNDNTPNIHSNTKSKQQSRRLLLSLTYKFNKIRTSK